MAVLSVTEQKQDRKDSIIDEYLTSQTLLTRIWVVSIYRGCFLLIIIGSEILGVVVELTNLVDKIVVKTLTSWLGITSAVAGSKAICSE